MKKILLIFCLAVLSINCFSQSPAAGQLKITIESFKCLIKSWDGVVEFDGHGNEASATYSYRIYSPSNPASARSGMNASPIFGSNINGMTRAGTQTPDLGGIREGDVVPVGMQIMNEHINADEYIIIAPTLWEWDGPRTSTFSSFNAQLENDLNWVINQPFPYANTAVDLQNPYGSRVTKIFDKYSYGQATKYHNIFKDFMCPLVGQGNKPVDLRSGTFNNQCMVIYPPTLLILDTRVLIAVYNHNKSIRESNYHDKPYQISNLVEIKFVENTYAIQTSNGAYSLLLKIEFTPDVVTTPTGITTLSKTGITRPKAETIRQTPEQMSVKALNSSSIIGKWSGTRVNDDGLDPRPIDFELTSNGEFIRVDHSTGLVAYKGVYIFSNNHITGSYKMPSGDTIAFEGTYDPFTKQLTCTLGWGNPPKGQGKWIVTKQ
ncbi:MAG: hypothetical protein ACTHMV_06770 [Chitinophagaceae bacterium]